MSDASESSVRVGGWFETVSEVLDPLLHARMLLALIEAAQSMGLLDAAQRPVSADDLSVETGLSPPLLAEVCEALTVNGVLEADGDRWTLSPLWQVITGPSAFAPLAETLATGDVRASTLRSLAEPTAYWSLEDADRYAYARALSPDPFSTGVVDAFRSGTPTDPEIFDRLRAGGRHLELGCGVAGCILCLLQVHPAMTAVAVELSPTWPRLHRTRHRPRSLGSTGDHRRRCRARGRRNRIRHRTVEPVLLS